MSKPAPENGEVPANSKERAFDLLVQHLAAIIPPEVAIQQLSGVPLVEAMKGYVFVPRAQWETASKRPNDNAVFKCSWPQRSEEQRRFGLAVGALEGLQFGAAPDVKERIATVLLELRKP